MILSDYLEKKLLDLMFVNTAYAAPATLYVGLFTTDPGESGVTGEFTIGGGAYARAVVTNNTTNFPQCSVIGTPTKSNGTVITWPTASTAWGTATHWAIYDAATAGNMLAHGALAASRAVAIGDTPKFSAGALAITASNASSGGLTNYAIRKLLDHVFGATAYTPSATIYLGLASAASGETLTEWSDSSYARPSAAFTAATLGAGTCPNTDAETFSASVVDAAVTLTHYGVWDDASSGNLLAYGPVNSSRTVQIGDSASLAAGACIITFQ